MRTSDAEFKLAEQRCMAPVAELPVRYQAFISMLEQTLGIPHSKCGKPRITAQSRCESDYTGKRFCVELLVDGVQSIGFGQAERPAIALNHAIENAMRQVACRNKQAA